MRVTVTGGAGMLGRHLIDRLLLEGYEVTSLDLVPRTGEETHRVIVGDVRDTADVATAVTGADVVVHAAAALPSYRAEQIRSVDVTGTQLVLDRCRTAGVERVVHISSTAVYGLPKQVPTREDRPREPVDAYSAAKAVAEQICERRRSEGMCVPVLRPKTFLGPERLGLFAMLFEWADEGRNFPVLGGGRIRCQMLDVADLVDAVVAAMTLPSADVNETFNLGATEFTTLRDEFQAVLDAAGRGGRVVALPVRPALAALRILDSARLSPVYKRLIYKLCADSYVSTDRAREKLGFNPCFSNTDALLRTYEWWRSRPATSRARRSGKTHREPWRQGLLGVAKSAF